MHKTSRIALFASGNGSNAHQIIRHFSTISDIEVALVISNKAGAPVLKRAADHGITTYVHSAEEIQNGQLLKVVRKHAIDFIALAGYLKQIGTAVIAAYPQKIVNIHPALLPKFGGKGMYGIHVHRAVIAARETLSGMTIHYVTENYDEGAIIEQQTCPVTAGDTAETIQQKVLQLEHAHYPKCIERLVRFHIGGAESNTGQ